MVRDTSSPQPPSCALSCLDEAEHEDIHAFYLYTHSSLKDDPTENGRIYGISIQLLKMAKILFQVFMRFQVIIFKLRFKLRVTSSEISLNTRFDLRDLYVDEVSDLRSENMLEIVN